MCFSRRLRSIAKKFTANVTHTMAIAISIGHSSSAYSFAWVNPSGSVIAAAAMIVCQPQKWIFDSVASGRALSRRCDE